MINNTITILLLLIFISILFLVFTRKTLHAIFSLIVLYVASALLINYAFGLEFIGLLFILVYIGAVATLFVFMIMMMKLKIDEDTALMSPSNNFTPFNLNFFRVIGIIWFLLILFEPSVEIFGDIINNFAQTPSINPLLSLYKNTDLPNLMGNFTPWSDLFFLGFLLYSIYAFQLVLIAYLLLAVLVAVMFLTSSDQKK